MTTRLSLGCNTHFSHSIRGTIRLFTAMAIPFSGSARKVESFGYGRVALYFGFFAVYCQFHTISVYEFTCKYKELLFDRMV